MIDTLSLPACGTPSALAHRPRAAQFAPLALAAAALIATALAAAPREAAAPLVSPAQPVATLMQPTGGSTANLLAAAEALRAELRDVPGVGAVELQGLQTAGLEVRYAPSSLARMGLRESDLLASVPAASAAPGTITVGPDLAQGGPGPVADLPVRAGQRAVRLGDVALVARVKLPALLVRLRQDGHPAVAVVVTPARGEAGPALDRRVARALAATPLPAGVTIR